MHPTPDARENVLIAHLTKAAPQGRTLSRPVFPAPHLPRDGRESYGIGIESGKGRALALHSKGFLNLWGKRTTDISVN